MGIRFFTSPLNYFNQSRERELVWWKRWTAGKVGSCSGVVGGAGSRGSVGRVEQHMRQAKGLCLRLRKKERGRSHGGRR